MRSRAVREFNIARMALGKSPESECLRCTRQCSKTKWRSAKRQLYD